MSSLRAKRRRRTQEDVSSRDRISALPDDLLFHILSHVSTKDAMATMILSKRWRFVWTMVPKLEYKFNYSNDNIEGVCRFIDKSLELNKAPVLETFRFHLVLRIHLDNRKVDASKWVENAVDRHVRVLELKLLNCRVLTKLPESIYTSKTLVELTLSNSILVDVPSSAYLPCLKKLLLVLVRFKDEDSLVRLLSSCSVLARSTIRLIIVYNWKQTLSIKKLRLPFIRVFCHASQMFRTSLSLVTSLTLYFVPPRDVDFSGITFSRLERFKLRTSSQDWSSLLLLVLNNSPKLRFLHIHSVSNSLSWKTPSSIPECLSSQLEVFEWKQYSGRRDEKQLLRYIFTNSKCLKKAKLNLRFNFRKLPGTEREVVKRKMVERKMVEELKSMSRASIMSKLVVFGRKKKRLW